MLNRHTAALGSVLVLMLFSAEAAPQSQPAQQKSDRQHDPITEDLAHGASFTLKIASDLPEFKFKVIPDLQEPDQYGNPRTIIKDVRVFRGSSNQPLQSLEDCEWSGMEAPPRGSTWFRGVDLNFDGYKDIYILTVWGATGNEFGCVWLYDPATERFDYSKEFSELSTFTLDPATKTIITHGNGGMAGTIFTVGKYIVDNNRPVLVATVAQDWDFGKQQYHCVVRQRRGREDTLVTVRDEWAKPKDNDDGPCDPSAPFQGLSDK